jgi:hypothetical protein
MSERSQFAAEMHTRLVSHLEERLADGEIDPDLLAGADPAACQTHIELQERWMTSALPDGRVPMDVLLDEKEDEFDDLTTEGLFLPVTPLWKVLGAIDDERLTALDWCGLPEAMLQV